MGRGPGAPLTNRWMGGWEKESRCFPDPPKDFDIVGTAPCVCVCVGGGAWEKESRYFSTPSECFIGNAGSDGRKSKVLQRI